MLHLQSHHLVTFGSAQLKAQRLYESLHPEDTTGTINSITTSDTTGTTVDTTSQDELLGKVQGMLDSKMKDMEQRLTNLIATNQAGSPPSATPPDNISDSSVIGENLHEDLSHSPLQLSQHVTTPPLIGKSLPPVPVKLREKILRGEYIDFRELLPSNMYSTPLQSNIVTLQLSKESSSEQALTIGAPKPTFKHQINSFTTWMQAWNVFLAIASDHFKNRVFEYLGYQRTITDAASKFRFAQWYEFDKRFRIKQANDKTARWDVIQSDEWLDCFTTPQPPPAPATPVSNRYTKPLHERKPCTYCGSLFHFPSNCHKATQSFRGVRQNPVPGRLANPTPTTRGNISQSASPQSLSTQRACWNFNATGGCSSSEFQSAHSCGVCGGAHSAKVCRRGPQP